MAPRQRSAMLPEIASVPNYSVGFCWGFYHCTPQCLCTTYTCFSAGVPAAKAAVSVRAAATDPVFPSIGALASKP
ncbi:unnamed protein product [Schistocephalus solidus]|uniref:Uncharacterized protein n=1 Tax=Schistocephalus solidus TaxID=70667 RepID=A0A183SCE0_SCHSO|nr:unnamed protein product [Schistocephalus solidus]